MLVQKLSVNQRFPLLAGGQHRRLAMLAEGEKSGSRTPACCGFGTVESSIRSGCKAKCEVRRSFWQAPASSRERNSIPAEVISRWPVNAVIARLGTSNGLIHPPPDALLIHGDDDSGRLTVVGLLCLLAIEAE